jgi:hypothetical protein
MVARIEDLCRAAVELDSCPRRFGLANQRRGTEQKKQRSQESPSQLHSAILIAKVI